METIEIRSAAALSGDLVVPGDKSISHRALMLAGLAGGHTEIEGLLAGDDVLATRAALVALGVGVSPVADGHCAVDGVGLHGLVAPLRELDLGNSGTAMRLLAGVLAAQRFPSRLTGDVSLRRRPMGRIIEPLARMGARVSGEDARPPLTIEPSDGLAPIDYRLPVASAQVKSCILLAGLYADGTTRVHEALPTRDHTERMLRAFGVPVGGGEGEATVSGGQLLRSPGRIAVPGDVSSAAFWLVAASLVPGSDLSLRGLGVNPRRSGVLMLLERMGADIAISNRREVCGEPVADLRVRHAPLRGIEVGAEEVPAAIDEFPALFVAAALARGRTRITGAGELRTKESDRITVMTRALAALGARVRELPDGAEIEGVDGLGGGVVDAAGDHRCAMALAVAGAVGEGVVVSDTANVRTSYPTFRQDAAALGMTLAEAAA